MKDKDKDLFFKDSWGRGWMLRFYEGPQLCFNVSCQNKANYDMSRTTLQKARREMICYKCFNKRVDLYGLVENPVHFE